MVAQTDGVPHLPQNYSLSAADWWANHPYNPATQANNYIPVGTITNSGPQVNVCEYASGSNTAGIKEALAQLPVTGGTLFFPNNCSPYILTNPLEWNQNLYAADFDWVEGGVNVDIAGRSNLHFVSDKPGTIIQGSFHIHSSAHAGRTCRHDPVRNFYFKNLTFQDPGRNHLAIIFEDTEDILFDNVTFDNASVLSVIKGNNLFFRESYFVNAPIHFDGSQFVGVVSSSAELDFANHDGIYDNPYFVDFHQNNDAICDGDQNGTLDIYEERLPKYFALDSNAFVHTSGQGPVVLGALAQAVFQNNFILSSAENPLTDFVKIHADNRPNPATGAFFNYVDYQFSNNVISWSETLFNLDVFDPMERGNVTIAYTTAADVTELFKGISGASNPILMCGNVLNGQAVDSACQEVSGQTAPDTTPAAPTTATPTAAPTSVAIFAGAPDLENLISDFAVNSSQTYQWQNLSRNQAMYIDRAYQFMGIPSQYQGFYYLQTANEDKFSSADSPLIGFTARQPVDVYLVYTNINSQVSSWLTDWNTDYPPIGSDLLGDEATRLVASRSLDAGETITLNGNGGLNDQTSMYNVLVAAADITSRESSSAAATSTAIVSADTAVESTFTEVRTFSQLPSELQAALAVIEPKRTSEVDNPFGTHTTVLKENHELSDLPSFLEMVSDTGYSWIKDYFGANQVTSDNSPASYWETFPDHYYDYFSEAQRLGFRIIIRLDFPRVDGRIPTTSEDMAYVAAFYRRAAEEFGAYVDDWEIDNEPNLGNFNPWITETEYANIAAVAAAAIREGDPDATIYAPGIAMLQALNFIPRPYIQNLIEAGLLDDIDVFSYHPYRLDLVDRFPARASEFAPYNFWTDYRSQIADLRSRIGEMPIAVTEMGYSTFRNEDTDTRNITLLTQAKYEQRSMILDFDLGVEPTINFIFKRPFEGQYEREYNFNIVEPDNTPKPIYYAVRNINAIFDNSMQHAPFDVTCENGTASDLQILAYTKPGEAYDELIIALWDAVEADDNNHQVGTCDLVMPSTGYEGFAFYDLLYENSQANELNFQVVDGLVIIPDIPVLDSPGIVRGIQLR
ncbi:MAG: hypothetical protein CL607_00800 [Anaerolineaceae bacterium]|nr:hypothetical protein [Anaerolineaceae bacterium]